MYTFVKLARQFALTLTVVATLAGGSVVARGEGGGVGSGGYPPPKLIVITPDYCIYDDGTIIYSNGTVGRVAGK